MQSVTRLGDEAEASCSGTCGM